MNKYQTRGGKDDPRNKAYNRQAWQETRCLVFARDNHTCQECGRHKDDLPPNLTLSCDHDPPLTEQDNPFDPAGCVTLCSSCHGKKHAAQITGRRRKVKYPSMKRAQEQHPGFA